jgi:hypothetical protein
VIIVYHPGPNVQWEVQEAFHTVPRDRLIFVVPLPSKGNRFSDWLRGEKRRNRERLLHASDTMARFTGSALPDPSKRTEIVVFKHGVPIFLERRRSKTFRRIAWIYGLCVGGMFVAVIAVTVAFAQRQGLSSSIVRQPTLTMLGTGLFVSSLIILQVLDFSRYGSYEQMLESHFRQRS